MRICFQPAYELVGHIKSGELSSVELLDEFRARYESANSALNALVTVDFDQAYIAARRADEQVSAGRQLGRLHGLPITIKDSFETAGMASTCGVPTWENHRPGKNAASVQSLVAAGAIVFGKSNVPPNVADLQTFNDLFGTTNNPWDTTRTPGGSSGGSAAAVAAGMTGLELGGDLGGSIRLPASFCGIYGHKTTFGLVPHRGQLPPGPRMVSPTDMACIGPMARSPQDLRLALDVLIDRPDGELWHAHVPEPAKVDLSQYRVGLWTDDSLAPLDVDVRSALSATATAIIAAGGNISETSPPLPMAEIFDLYWQLALPVFAQSMPDDEFVQAADFGDSRPPTGTQGAQNFAHYSTLRHRLWLEANERRLQLVDQVQLWFDSFDVILAPACIVPAIPHDHSPFDSREIRINGQPHSYLNLVLWSALANLTYLPVTVAPTALSADGLPIGVQIMGRRGADKITIRFAELLAEVHGGYTPPHTPLSGKPSPGIRPDQSNGRAY